MTSASPDTLVGSVEVTPGGTTVSTDIGDFGGQIVVPVPGPKGEKGDTGDTGPAGSIDTFIHDQSSAAATWTISHNKGTLPLSVRLLDGSNTEFEADVTDTDTNTTVVTHASPKSGTARLTFS